MSDDWRVDVVATALACVVFGRAAGLAWLVGACLGDTATVRFTTELRAAAE